MTQTCIVEKTIGPVRGHSTATCKLFLLKALYSNKAVGTTLRALSKPPQRRQGPELCPPSPDCKSGLLQSWNLIGYRSDGADVCPFDYTAVAVTGKVERS